MAIKLDIQKFELTQDASWSAQEAGELLATCSAKALNLTHAIDTVTIALEGLDDNWYSENAAKFGGEFVPAFKTFTQNTVEYINSCGNAIVTAARNYAATGGGSFGGSWSEKSAKPCSATFNVKDGAGRQGANPPAKGEFNTASTTGVADIKSTLAEFTSAVEASLAYSNSNMGALSGTVSQCNQQIATWQDDNTMAFNRLATNEIDNFVETGEQVTSAFSG